MNDSAERYTSSQDSNTSNVTQQQGTKRKREVTLETRKTTMAIERRHTEDRAADQHNEAEGEDDSSHMVSMTTKSIFECLKTRYKIYMAQEQFVGLLAYLEALMDYCYSIDINAIDSFVYQYPKFEQYATELEAQRAVDPRISLPAYHQWFLDQAMPSENSERDPILTQRALRCIFEENPYTFLRARLSLEVIAEIQRADELLVRGRPFMPGRP